jgi:hypothetical protein
MIMDEKFLVTFGGVHDQVWLFCAEMAKVPRAIGQVLIARSMCS